jgi:Beta-lactamase
VSCARVAGAAWLTFEPKPGVKSGTCRVPCPFKWSLEPSGRQDCQHWTKEIDIGGAGIAKASFAAPPTKLFTATAVLQLKERGKIDLDAPFRSYFPEFPYDKITVRHLLSHTSGLPDVEELLETNQE